MTQDDGNAFLRWCEANRGNWLATYKEGGPPLWVHEMQFELMEIEGDLLCAAEANGVDDDDPVLQAKLAEAERICDIVNQWVKDAYG